MSHGRIAGGVLALAAALTASPLRGGSSEIRYVLKDETVLFTNLPEAGARPVPGLGAVPGASVKGGGGRPLPVTVYDPFIDRVALENGLAPELIKAVALVESGFNAKAVSKAGAQGLMQLMPATAKRYGVQDAFDPLENLRAGSEHLRDLLDEFDGDLSLALAAYNAGSGAVRRHGGVPNYAETKDYVRKVHERLGTKRSRVSAPKTRPSRAPEKVSFRVMDDGSVLLVN